MAVDEQSRRRLYDRLEEVLGVGQGDADVSTSFTALRGELALFEQRLLHRFDRLDDQLARHAAEITAGFRGEITAALTLQVRQTVLAIIGVLLAVAGLTAAVLGLS